MRTSIKVIITALLMGVLFLHPIAALASSGTCGEALSWTLNDAGTLIISGTGKMTDYTAGTAPWGTDINKVIIETGVTSIGNYAFYNCKNLSNALVSDNVTIIGIGAFKGCSTFCTMQPLYEDTEPSLGDINEDGVTDIIDAVILLKLSAGMDVLIPDHNDDINNDGKLDIQDILAILQYCAGWDVANMPADLSVLLRMLMEYVAPCAHTGRTELSGEVTATTEQEGYTGDLYCLECGEMIEPGITLPKLMELPVTGDSSHPVPWVTLLFLSGSGLLLLRRNRRVLHGRRYS